ncbi:MAG: DUF4430 domain-containing protein [Candidatus Pristimantibacillus sp.]
MKHWWKPLIAVAFALLLASCSIQTVDQYERMPDEEKSVEKQGYQQDSAQVQEPVEEETIDEDEPESEHKNQAAPNESPEKDASTELEKSGPKASSSPVEPEQDKGGGKPGQQEKPATSTPSAQPSTSPTSKDNDQPTPTSKPADSKKEKGYVTIAIHAETLLTNWDLLEPALQDEKYVPKDGVILKAVKYELLSDDETVWDVLLRATKEHKIQLEYQGASKNIYKSVYVEGINHLYEFSAGELSGWMYQVNGTYPNYGCGQYVVEDGDVIEWHYTVDLGRDLGTGM